MQGAFLYGCVLFFSFFPLDSEKTASFFTLKQLSLHSKLNNSFL